MNLEVLRCVSKIFYALCKHTRGCSMDFQEQEQQLDTQRPTSFGLAPLFHARTFVSWKHSLARCTTTSYPAHFVVLASPRSFPSSAQIALRSIIALFSLSSITLGMWWAHITCRGTAPPPPPTRPLALNSLSKTPLLPSLAAFTTFVYDD